MSDIKNYNPAEEETLDSREMAGMVEKQHKNLLRGINGHIKNMKQDTELKIESNEFFIPSTYTDGTGRKLPCSFVTKKGCEFIANKLTGEKGTKFTAMYVTRFDITEKREKAAIGGKTAKNGKTPEELAATDKWVIAMLLNVRNRAVSFPQKLYDRAGTKLEYQAMALSDFYSEDGTHLPRMAFQGIKQIYDKSAVAEKLGVYSKASGGKASHVQTIGAIIPTLGIPEDERGWLPYCNNGYDDVDYQYTESVVEKVRAWIEAHGRSSPITVNGKDYAVVYKKE